MCSDSNSYSLDNVNAAAKQDSECAEDFIEIDGNFYVPRYLKAFSFLTDRLGGKRGMTSNLLFIIPDFFLHFPNELCNGYLRFEVNWKIPLGR